MIYVKPVRWYKNDFAKNKVFDELVTNINAIDIRRLVSETHYNTDKSGIEKQINNADKKILDISRLVKKQIAMLISLRLKLK